MTEEEQKMQTQEPEGAAENGSEMQDQGAGAPAEKSRWDSYMDEFSQRNPDVDMTDDEARHNRYLDERDADKKQLKQYEDDYAKVNDMMYQNPNSADFLDALYGGKSAKDMAKSLIRTFGQTLKDALDDPSDENVEAFAEAWEQNANEIKQNDAWQKEWQQNDEASQQTLAQWAADNGKTPEQMDAIKDKFAEILANYGAGIITTEMLDMVDKGMNYDGAVAQATEKGRTEGKAANAKEKIRRSKGDGMPIIGGTAQAPKPAPKEDSDDIFSTARNWNG